MHGAYPFCYYYRGYLPAVYSGQMAVNDFLRLDSKIDPIKLKNHANQADVVVFQRPTDRKMYDLAVALKKQGKKILFENDDTYSAIPLDRLENERQVKIAKEMNNNLNDFLRFADGAIASTEILADEFRKINKNVAVLKNTVDPRDKFVNRKNDTGKFRVGLIGSVTTNDDYFHLKADLRRLDALGDVTIVVMGVKYKDGTYLPIMQEDYDFWSSLKNVEWHPYCHVTEYMYNISKLALDVAIIPRKDHYFNYCKSNLKFLEISLLGIPVIAQGFINKLSPYQGADEDYMTIAVDNWYDTIITVKNEYATYKKLAEKAQEYVLKEYNIANYYKEWVKTIEALCK